MTSSADELDDLTSELIGFASRYGRTFLKASLIGLMATFSIWIFTESASKALLFGFAFFIISMFRTWGRFLEPIGLLVFVAAVVYTCDQDIVSQFRVALAH